MLIVFTWMLHHYIFAIIIINMFSKPVNRFSLSTTDISKPDANSKNQFSTHLQFQFSAHKDSIPQSTTQNATSTLGKAVLLRLIQIIAVLLFLAELCNIWLKKEQLKSKPISNIKKNNNKRQSFGKI